MLKTDSIIAFCYGDSIYSNSFGAQIFAGFDREAIFDFLDIYQSVRDYFYQTLYNASFSADEGYPAFVRLSIFTFAINKWLNEYSSTGKDPGKYNLEDMNNFLKSVSLDNIAASRGTYAEYDIKKQIISNYGKLARDKGTVEALELIIKILRSITTLSYRKYYIGECFNFPEFKSIPSVDIDESIQTYLSKKAYKVDKGYFVINKNGTEERLIPEYFTLTDSYTDNTLTKTYIDKIFDGDTLLLVPDDNGKQIKVSEKAKNLIEAKNKNIQFDPDTNLFIPGDTSIQFFSMAGKDPDVFKHLSTLQTSTNSKYDDFISADPYWNPETTPEELLKKLSIPTSSTKYIQLDMINDKDDVYYQSQLYLSTLLDNTFFTDNTASVVIPNTNIEIDM